MCGVGREYNFALNNYYDQLLSFLLLILLFESDLYIEFLSYLYDKYCIFSRSFVDNLYKITSQQVGEKIQSFHVNSLKKLFIVKNPDQQIDRYKGAQQNKNQKDRYRYNKVFLFIFFK